MIRPLDLTSRRERRQVLHLVYQSQHAQHVELEQRDSPEESRRTARAVWRLNLRDPHMRYYVAKVAGRIAGYILLRELPGGVGFVDDLSVDPAFRHQGIGRQLVEFGFNWARDHGLKVMKLTTQRTNAAAAATYRAAGFREVPSEYIDFEKRL